MLSDVQAATGHGLGMSAVLGIVRSHREALQLQSTRGKGTVIDVFLPASSQASEASTEADPSQRNSTTLVVDDEDPIRRIVKRTLEYQGYGVVLATNAEDGLAVFRTAPDAFAAVLMDQTMQGMPGGTPYTPRNARGPPLPATSPSASNGASAATGSCERVAKRKRKEANVLVRHRRPAQVSPRASSVTPGTSGPTLARRCGSVFHSSCSPCPSSRLACAGRQSRLESCSSGHAWHIDSRQDDPSAGEQVMAAAAQRAGAESAR